jgi:glycosyltransferase involved in cell wall biosynthesis
MPCAALSELLPPSPGRTGWPWMEQSAGLPEMMPDGSPWPRISIVTPSYNQSEFIEEAIRSVLLQGYPDLEYIIMDGGSTDGSVEIIRRYEPWLSYLHIGPDGGQAAAIAEGFGRATGEILAWLNSDDRYRPGALARVAGFFTDHRALAFGSGDVNHIDSDGQLVRRIWAIRPTRFLTANLGIHCWPQQGCFWRRWAYEQVGGIDDSLRFCMDRDLFIRLAGSGPSRRIPGPPLADFRIHDHAKSSTILDIAQEESDALIAKYGNARIRSNTRLLRLLWRFWCQPTVMRRRLKQRYGWEL